MQNRSVALIALILFLVVVGVLFSLWQPLERANHFENEKYNLKEQGILLFDSPREFEIPPLVHTSGNQLTHSFFTGKWTLIYFGYTSCSDVCPVTLTTLDQLIKRLQKKNRGLASALKVMMVTVDPKRDTMKKLRQYTAFFNPDFTGVTGTEQNIATFARALHVSYTHKTNNKIGDYHVEHSCNITIINPDGDYQGFIRPPFTIKELTSSLVTLNDIF